MAQFLRSIDQIFFSSSGSYQRKLLKLWQRTDEAEHSFIHSFIHWFLGSFCADECDRSFALRDLNPWTPYFYGPRLYLFKNHLAGNEASNWLILSSELVVGQLLGSKVCQLRGQHCTVVSILASGPSCSGFESQVCRFFPMLMCYWRHIAITGDCEKLLKLIEHI